MGLGVLAGAEFGHDKRRTGDFPHLVHAVLLDGLLGMGP